MTKPKLLLSWSSGKDSAWTLHRLRLESAYDIVGLVTTVNQKFNRVAMHGVRYALLQAQAAAAELALWPVELPSPCSNAEYEARMKTLIDHARAAHVTHMAFGDLFLQDIRVYRENQLKDTGITPVFPLWNSNTQTLAHEMVSGGLRAKITCIDPRRLPATYAGRDWHETLAELPATVDPCGENGEFHTFCYSGPMFRTSLDVRGGEVVERDGFVFADFMPGAIATETNPDVA